MRGMMVGGHVQSRLNDVNLRQWMIHAIQSVSPGAPCLTILLHAIHMFYLPLHVAFS